MGDGHRVGSDASIGGCSLHSPCGSGSDAASFLVGFLRFWRCVRVSVGGAIAGLSVFAVLEVFCS